MTELRVEAPGPPIERLDHRSMRGRTTTTGVMTTSVGAVVRQRADWLATEEPMAIRVRGRSQDPVNVAVTMRTPGNDFELAAGFLVTEGLLRDRREVARIAYCGVAGDAQQYNVVTVDLTVPFSADFAERHFYSSSSCGICGKATLDQVQISCPTIAKGTVVARSVVVSLPESLRREQRLFERTGGLHAAALFELDGRLLEAREDVGRHNAVDKIVGRALLTGKLPLGQQVMLVSGRLSFEIVQKAAVAGIPIICAVSAPSSLAVEAGERLGLTLVGFLRGDTFNIYSHPERIDALA